MTNLMRFRTAGSGPVHPLSWLWVLVLAACGGGGGGGGGPVASGDQPAPEASGDQPAQQASSQPEIQYHLRDWLKENGVGSLPKTNTENRADREIVVEWGGENTDPIQVGTELTV